MASRTSNIFLITLLNSINTQIILVKSKMLIIIKQLKLIKNNFK